MKKLLYLIFSASLLVTSCTSSDDELPNPSTPTPTVTTTTPVKMNDTTYTCGGNVTAQGTSAVTERGVAVSLDANPTIDDVNDVIVKMGTGTGVFSMDLSPFYSGYTYHVRAYAKNASGVAYGADVTVTPGGNPTGCNVVNVTSAITSPTNWTAGNVYVVNGSVAVKSTLTIDAGVVIKCSGNDVNGTFDVQSGGTIIANGTAANHIVFTSLKDDTYCGDNNGDGAASTPNKGDWNCIALDGGNNSQFSYCDFLYGGSYNGYVVHVGVSSTAFNFDHCTFAHTKNSTSDFAAFNGGGNMIDAATSKLTNCTFYDNDRPLYCNSYYTVDPSNSFHNPANPTQGNRRNGIFMWHASNPANATVSFLVTEIPYVMTSHFSGGGSAGTGTLNFASGAIMKFTSSSIGIARAANRTVNFSGAILTSYKDDANGGDTNGDGAASSPANGDWEGFWDYVTGTWVTGSNILYAGN